MQNLKFSEQFLLDASQFGLHLSNSEIVINGAPVWYVSDLPGAYIAVLSPNLVFFADPCGPEERPVIRYAQSVEHLHSLIIGRRQIRTGTWN